MPPGESPTDPAPALPLPGMNPAPPISSSLPSTNGDEETALARLADDGGPPLPARAETSTEPILSNEQSETMPAPSLEQRVRRLEEVVALLQERRTAQARVASIPAATPPAHRPPEARPTPAAPVASPPAATAIMLDLGKRLLGTAPPAAAAGPAPAPSIAAPANRASLMWLLRDTWAEVRAIVRMFVDPRYQLPWSARVLPLLILAAILTSRFWVPGSSIPFLGDWLLVKLVDLLLAFLLFKWLGHEARRYRQTSPDLPASLRL